MLINLVTNELKKTNKITLSIGIIFLLCINLLFVVLNDKGSIVEMNKEVYLIEESEYKSHGFFASYEEYLKQYKDFEIKNKKNDDIQKYVLEHDIKSFTNEKNLLEKSMITALFASLIIVIIAGNIFSKEFNKGTIKTLLTKPVKRSKIFVSKFIVINIINIVLLLTIIISMTVLVGVFNKINIFSLKEAVIIGEKIQLINYYFLFLKKSIINYMPVLFIGNLATALSCLTLNTAFSVGLGVFLSIGAVTISEILFAFKLKFIRYTFLPYLDFNIFNDYYALFITNISYGINLNLKLGIIILLLNFILFKIISFLLFNKKDIKNL